MDFKSRALKEMSNALESAQTKEEMDELCAAFAQLGIVLKKEDGGWKNMSEALKELSEVWSKSQVALIEIGDNEKDGYVTLKGSLDQFEHELAHTYWYPENIDDEETKQEIADLMEFYPNVAVLTPLPNDWSFNNIGLEI